MLSIAPVVAAAIQNARAHAVERAATERLADVESQHAEAVRILDEQLREPAAALARDTAHAAAQLARDPVAAAEMLGRVHETALAIAESIVGLAYVLQAQSRALLEPRTPAHAKPVREPVVTRKR